MVVVVEAAEEKRLLRRKVVVVVGEAAWRRERAEEEVGGLCWVAVVEVLPCLAGMEEVEEGLLWVPSRVEAAVELLVPGSGVVEAGAQKCEEGVEEVGHLGRVEAGALERKKIDHQCKNTNP